VHNVKVGRERRHIDKARRERMFQIQMLRERNRRELEAKKQVKKEMRQAKLMEEAKNNSKDNTNIDDINGKDNMNGGGGGGDDDGNNSNVGDDDSAIFHMFDDDNDEEEEDENTKLERMLLQEQERRSMSSPLLNMDLIRPCTNHAYSISPTHKTKSRIAKIRQDTFSDDATGKSVTEKIQRSSQGNDGNQMVTIEKNNKTNDVLTFTRRQKRIVVDDTSGVQQQEKQKRNCPTRNKQLLALQNYKDEFTTLNYKTPIQFERMTKSLRYPEMFIENTLKQENEATKSINEHLNAYRKKMKKQIRENNFSISKDELHTILKLKGKKMPNDDGETDKKKQNTTFVDNASNANGLYYEKKILKVLTPHEEKLQYKRINKLRVEQKERVERNELLYKQRRMQRRRRQVEDNDSLKKKNGRKADKTTPHMRIHYSDVDDVIAYKLKQKKKQLLLSYGSVGMQDGAAAAAADRKIDPVTNGTKRKKKRMKDAPVFQDLRFANSYVQTTKQIVQPTKPFIYITI